MADKETNNTATLVKSLDGWRGDATLYRCDPPHAGNEYVIASAVDVLGTPETYIFAANEEGECVDWLELDGSYRGGLSHAEAFDNAGYRIVTVTA